MKIRQLLALGLAIAAVPASAQLKVVKRADLALPVTLGPDQGAILVGFRRPDKMSAGKGASAAFARYDLERRDVIFQPKNAKKQGDTTTYWVLAKSGDKKLTADYALMIVSAGDYVLFGATPAGNGMMVNTFCLGAPTFRVKAGEIAYFGDLTPYSNVKLTNGSKAMAMAYSSHPEDARASHGQQAKLAEAVRPAELRNEATYACAGQAMLAYAVPGAAPLEAPSAAASETVAPADSEATPSASH
jgi:hypothetical protein